MNGIIYTSGYGFGGTVYAINESDGSIRWRAPVNNGDQPALAVSSGAVYASSACDETAAFDPLTGAALWHHATSCKSGNGMTPVLHSGRLYVRDPALPTTSSSMPPPASPSAASCRRARRPSTLRTRS